MKKFKDLLFTSQTKVKHVVYNMIPPRARQRIFWMHNKMEIININLPKPTLNSMDRFLDVETGIDLNSEFEKTHSDKKTMLEHPCLAVVETITGNMTLYAMGYTNTPKLTKNEHGHIVHFSQKIDPNYKPNHKTGQFFVGFPDRRGKVLRNNNIALELNTLTKHPLSNNAIENYGDKLRNFVDGLIIWSPNKNPKVYDLTKISNNKKNDKNQGNPKKSKKKLKLIMNTETNSKQSSLKSQSNFPDGDGKLKYDFNAKKDTKELVLNSKPKSKPVPSSSQVQHQTQMQSIKQAQSDSHQIKIHSKSKSKIESNLNPSLSQPQKHDLPSQIKLKSKSQAEPKTYQHIKEVTEINSSSQNITNNEGTL